MKLLDEDDNRMAKDKVCCFHIFTAAALVGILQVVLIMISLTTSSVVLDHWQTWKSDFQRNHELYMAMPKRTSPGPTTSFGPLFATRSTPPTTTTPPFMDADEMYMHNTALESFVQIHVAHHIAIYATWLVFMFMYAMAFREMRPILVLPNLVMQVIALILIAVLSGTLIARMVKLCRQYQNAAENSEGDLVNDIEIRYAFHAVLLGSLVILWFVMFIFTFVGYRFYRYLGEQMKVLFPEVPMVTFPPPAILNQRVMSAGKGSINNGRMGFGGGGDMMMTTNLP